MHLGLDAHCTNTFERVHSNRNPFLFFLTSDPEQENNVTCHRFHFFVHLTLRRSKLPLRFIQKPPESQQTTDRRGGVWHHTIAVEQKDPAFAYSCVCVCFNPYLDITSVPKPVAVPAGLSSTQHVAVAVVTTGEIME